MRLMSCDLGIRLSCNVGCSVVSCVILGVISSVLNVLGVVSCIIFDMLVLCLFNVVVVRFVFVFICLVWLMSNWLVLVRLMLCGE